MLTLLCVSLADRPSSHSSFPPSSPPKLPPLLLLLDSFLAMFYSAEILTRAKGGISIFWLAGTLGKGGAGGKKLTKAEILKSNVVKAWYVPSPPLMSSCFRRSRRGERGLTGGGRNSEKVIAPEEPLALRLSATLLQGIARVYQQQVRTPSSFPNERRAIDDTDSFLPSKVPIPRRRGHARPPEP